MRTGIACAAAVLALLSPVRAGEPSSAPKQLAGDYQVFGGSLADMQPPTAKDKKVAFLFTGPLAKELFTSIGPDVKEACSGAAGYRERRRGDLLCTLNEDGYRCYLGLDVVRGKSTGGATC